MAPKRYCVSRAPAVNLKEELNAFEEKLNQQRVKTNHDLEYAFVTTTAINEVADVNDEFNREAIFAEQARQAAIQMLPRLKSLGIPTEVPLGYRGERVKDDKQMAKVRDTLKAKKDTIEKSERVRKLRELKKMGKKIQTEVLKKRSKEKKEFLEKVKKRPVAELFEE